MLTTQALTPTASAAATSAELGRILRQRFSDGASQFGARATYRRGNKGVTVTVTVDGEAHGSRTVIRTDRLHPSADVTVVGSWLTFEFSDYLEYDRPSDRVTSHIVDDVADSAEMWLRICGSSRIQSPG